jgi:assimilatory nitrate reductase catalytic subunit
LSGASRTTEKAYLVGKFAHMCLRTSNIDYNGRLCMVSAAAGNKKPFGIDRAAIPWSDILKAEVVWISGANIAECAPITTDYVWQARENGAKIIVVDPRITPVARTCDLFLPIKPGRDVALFNGVLHLMIENNWLDHDFIEKETVGFETVAEHVREWTPRHTAEITGIAESAVRQAAEWWGRGKTSFLMHARGHRASQPRRSQRAGRHQYGLGFGADRSRRLRLCDDYRPRKRSGRAGTRPEM